ncbi:lipopolysaccharide kinase (Kdo/WaaP) family protein [Mumia flava]|uniref:Lipopolysaccharide kinase (Kdo/WaaP) family protein n=1 Tax=Mumia flava TaxID=1348852 RepID=A0A2M9BGQ3_9ACTN|nr:DUF4032 domain-containing protein [Mumia flava]PJJ57084.1 lipopolysaccharide kinase (Kdo/WaaP) family protein [Mumia flava]
MVVHALSTRPRKELFDLPWRFPLAQWPDDLEVDLARGIHRHVVRFVRVGGAVMAIKETNERFARREYGLLRDLRRIDLPTVEPVAVITGRVAHDGEPLGAALVTAHLSMSLPYRSLFEHPLTENTQDRVVDAMVVLLVRLHIEGFFWGDCSLSNTLFRRSAGELAAYLVDAETGALHEELSPGQRAEDLDLARTNVFGELLDLQAGGLLDPGIDPLALVDHIGERYDELWDALTGAEEFGSEELWRIEQRIERLNDLGFDVDELDIVTDFDGESIRIQPKVVEPGHHTRRLQGLTGLDLEDAQARRLLNDLDAFTASHGWQEDDPMVVAHRWLTDVWERLARAVPADARDVVEAAQFFHDVLVHRWHLSQSAGHEVDIFDAADDYIRSVLPGQVSALRAAGTATSGPT